MLTYMIFADIYDCDPDILNPKPATRIEVWYWGFSHTWGQEDCHGLSNATISDPKTKVTWNTWRDNEITGISACFHANFCVDSVSRRLQATWVCFCTSSVGFYNFSASQWVQGLNPLFFSLVTFFSYFGHSWHLWTPRNCFLNYTKYTRSTTDSWDGKKSCKLQASKLRTQFHWFTGSNTDVKFESVNLAIGCIWFIDLWWFGRVQVVCRFRCPTGVG